MAILSHVGLSWEALWASLGAAWSRLGPAMGQIGRPWGPPWPMAMAVDLSTVAWLYCFNMGGAEHRRLK